MTTIGFLHTSSAHVATFERLVAEIAPEVGVVSSVREWLLEQAVISGTGDPGVIGGVREAIAALGESDVVVCTCSTIGGVAESIGTDLGVRVVRVDRSMAEQAVRLAVDGGGRIAVAAAVESTLAPTSELLASIVARSGSDVTVDVHLIDGAWERFEAGDQDGYLATIADALPGLADGADVVVLAQASMAGAADLALVGVPVLSSPRTAVESLLG